MRPINLIPAEERRGEHAPMRVGPLAYVVVGALASAFAGVYLLVSAGNSISEQEARIAGLEQELDATAARTDALQSFADFASLEQGRTGTVATLAQSRFDWERVMRELALVIPPDVSLTSLAGAVSPGAAGSSGGAGGDAGGTVIEAPTLQIGGCGADHESVAQTAAALRDIDGVTRVGLQSSSQGGVADQAGSTSGLGAGGSCTDPEAANFDLTVAFDEVEIDPVAGVVIPEEVAPAVGDGSGVAETEAERQAAKAEVDSAQKKGREAVETFVPGT